MEYTVETDTDDLIEDIEEIAEDDEVARYWPALKITPFDELPITTMTIVATLKGELSLDHAFILFPITKVTTDTIKKKGKNISLPKHDIPGSILSMRYKGETRGIIVHSKKHKNDDASTTTVNYHFKNCITIDMSLNDKNINFRLSGSTMHMCGVKNFNQVYETFIYLKQHIDSINKELHYLRENVDETINAFRYITKNLTQSADATELIILPPESTDNIDLRCFNFMTRNISEYNHPEFFLKEIAWFIRQPSIANDDMLVEKLETSMINFNYSLGFPVNRRLLAQYMLDKPGVEVKYDNAINHSVRVTIPFEIGADDKIRRKKKKGDEPHHTFIIYKSGCVTQSGPNIPLMKDVYYRFFEMIDSIKHLIQRRRRIKLRIIHPDGSVQTTKTTIVGNSIDDSSDSYSNTSSTPSAVTI